MKTKSKLVKIFLPKRVILHCSATPDYPEDNKAYDIFGAADIDVWHKQRGFDGIGYHKVIRQSGALEKGRPEVKMGAHCKGHNSDSLGVCMIGSGKLTRDQIISLGLLYMEINDKYGISWLEWFGHYEFTDRKTCPSVSMELVRAYLRLL